MCERGIYEWLNGKKRYMSNYYNILSKQHKISAIRGRDMSRLLILCRQESESDKNNKKQRWAISKANIIARASMGDAYCSKGALGRQ